MHWIYLSLDPEKSLVDWPTGTRNLGKSLPMHVYRLSDEYLDVDLFSSAVKLNTQYMHSMWFQIRLTRDMDLEEVNERLRDNHRVATTAKREANLIFSFGRDHGYYGRILSQAVIVLPTLLVRDKREVYGFCFTPQDGNSLLSSVAATLWVMDPSWDSVAERLEPLRRWVYQEI